MFLKETILHDITKLKNLIIQFIIKNFTFSLLFNFDKIISNKFMFRILVSATIKTFKRAIINASSVTISKHI